MKYIKSENDKKVSVVPNSFSKSDLPEGYCFTTKRFYKKVIKSNAKMNQISGGTKKGRPDNISRVVTKEHLQYGDLFEEKEGKIIRKGQLIEV